MLDEILTEAIEAQLDPRAAEREQRRADALRKFAAAATEEAEWLERLVA
jgi:hypothetical protein